MISRNALASGLRITALGTVAIRQETVGYGSSVMFSAQAIHVFIAAKVSNMKTNSTLLSNVVMFTGIATTMAMICLPVFFVQFPIWLSLILGIAIGVPLLVVGFRLHPESVISKNPNEPFLPTKVKLVEYAWAFIAFCTILALVIAPIVILGATIVLLPGDSWPIVVLRVVACCGAIAWWTWSPPVAEIANRLFRGKVSDSLLNSLTGNESPESTNFVTAAIKKWEFESLFSVVAYFSIAIAAFCLAYEVINLNQPWIQRPIGRGKVRGILRILAWLASHPNTTKAFAWCVCIGSIMAFLTRSRSCVIGKLWMLHKRLR